jgi:uncharacterized protein YutE (UPF0331/DUF86 family)
MVDKPKCDQMLANLRGYMAELRRLSTTERNRFLADPDKIGNAKYHFVIAIECCIDVANHIISSENLRFPNTNADSFQVLAENGILPAEMKTRYAAMAKFRNRLVHLYWEVDDAQVHDYLGASLADIDS